MPAKLKFRRRRPIACVTPRPPCRPMPLPATATVAALAPGAQRRVAFRVPVPSPNWITATILGDDGEAAGAIVLDLSRMGMAAALGGTFDLPRGTRLRCRLVLEDEPLETEVVVCHSRSESATTRVGLEFTALSPLHDSLLSRAVFRLQRYLLRRKSRRGPAV